jgi:uncharacterized protein YhaN
MTSEMKKLEARMAELQKKFDAIEGEMTKIRNSINAEAAKEFIDKPVEVRFVGKLLNVTKSIAAVLPPNGPPISISIEAVRPYDESEEMYP